MLAAVSTVCASAVWMAVEMAATWWVRKVLGDARPSPYCVRSVAPGSRDSLARTRSVAMKEAPSAPVVSAKSKVTPMPRSSASAYWPGVASTKPVPVVRSYLASVGSPICLRPKTSLRRRSSVQPKA